MYMAFPPTVPERNELVEQDLQGLNRPKKSAIRGLRINNHFRDMIFDLVLILVCGLL